MSIRTPAQPKAVRKILDRTATQPLALAPDLPSSADTAPRPENLARIAELDRLFAAFLTHATDYLNHSVATIAWYRRSYAAYRRFLLAGAFLDDAIFVVRTHDIVGWVSYLRSHLVRGRSLTPIAVNTCWRGLRRFFVHVEATGAGTNPFRGIKPPKFQPPVPKAKSGDECRKILAAAYHYPWPAPDIPYKRVLAQAVIGVMLLAGLRRSEVVNLRNGDVDLVTGTINIERGKGIAGGRRRTAYISPELKDHLTAYLRKRESYGERFESAAFFVSPKTTQGLSLEGLRKIVAKVARASGVPFTAHALRHSFITHLLRSDVPLHIVKDLAGHKDVATTLGYLRVFDEDLHKGIRKIRFT
jgi:integrase